MDTSVIYQLLFSHVIQFVWGDSGQHPRSHVTSSKPLLVVFIEGLRWDQVEGLPGFRRVIDSGVRTNYLQPVFPTHSLPNLYSVVTGRWPESHGILDNYMFDMTHQRFFHVGEKHTDNNPIWWRDATPLWITAKTQGRISHLYSWPSCDVTFNGIRPDVCVPFTKGSTFQDFRNFTLQALDSLQNDECHIAGIYTDYLDHVSHQYGPNSNESREALRQIDTITQHIMDWLHNANNSNNNGTRMRDLVDFILLSPYGMSDISPDNVIPLSDVIKVTDLQRYLLRGSQTLAHIWPAEGRLHSVYADLSSLQNVHVFTRESLPERYHYKRHARAAPIIVAAHPGWTLGPIGRPPRDEDVIRGQHGYLPEYKDMKGVFLATGPSFYTKRRFPPITSLDIYQIMCHTLDIVPAAHNGTWSRVRDMLTSRASGFYSTCFIHVWNVYLVIYVIWV